MSKIGDRKIDRQTDSERQRQRARQTERYIEVKRQRETVNKETDKQT